MGPWNNDNIERITPCKWVATYSSGHHHAIQVKYCMPVGSCISDWKALISTVIDVELMAGTATLNAMPPVQVWIEWRSSNSRGGDPFYLHGITGSASL
jgi:hypothetical protein